MLPTSNWLNKLPQRIYLYLKSREFSRRYIFNKIYRRNEWGGKESVSGRGSDLSQTRAIIEDFPTLFREFSISTMLDIPCGDFHWMQHVDLSEISYIGADIVDELVKLNAKKYSTDQIGFNKIDLIKDKLPCVDLVFCRDCLVHLSFQDALKALSNISSSGSKFILTTSFTDRHINKDIQTGQWRTLNLGQPPFNFPKPLKIIVENCTEGDGIYRDKSLCLWRLQDIKECLLVNNK